MSSISQVSETMQTILTSRATALERASGFVERSTAQLDGAIFSQTTVLTWMQNPDASSSQLRHTAASLGVHVSNQALSNVLAKGRCGWCAPCSKRRSAR